MGIGLVLKAGNNVVGIAHDDHVAGGFLLAASDWPSRSKA